MRYRRILTAAALVAFVMVTESSALPVGDVYTNGFPNTVLSGGAFTVTSGAFEDNAVRIVTVDNVNSPTPAAHQGGVSFTIAISNGENGITVGAGPGPGGGGTNTDANNPEPVGDAIDIINGGDGTTLNRLTNGNAFRFSVWMRHDPANPMVVEPSVEPVLKFELWSEAQSVFGDFAGRKPFADQGDRLWDTDLNAPHEFYEGFDLEKATHIDISNNGSVVDWTDPVESLAPTDAWTRFETKIVINDDPDESGLGWDIAGQGFFVDAIEEVRATFFIGDFTGDTSGFDNGGRFFIDNALLEAFPDKATMDSTPNPNTVPVGALVGDYNDDGSVDAADYVMWRKNVNRSGATLKNRDPAVTGLVKPADHDSWVKRYGQTLPGGGGIAVIAYAPGQNVPEPCASLLMPLGVVTLSMLRRR